MKTKPKYQEIGDSKVQEAKQESEIRTLFMRGKVETEVWTERMLAALISGVKGGKWPYAMAKFLLRDARVVHNERSPC